MAPLAIEESAIVGSARRIAVDETVRRAAMLAPDKLAVVGGATYWTYAELDRILDSLALRLADMGIGAGGLVALLARNSHWYVAMRYALSRAGAIVVPINFMLSSDEVAYILKHSGATRLFVDRGCANVGMKAASAAHLSEIHALPDLDDRMPEGPTIRPFDLHLPHGGFTPVSHPIAQVIYTSGTEARPKGAILTHNAVLYQYQSCIIACDWRKEAIVANAMPLFHCAQLDAFLGPSLQVGATNFIVNGAAPDMLIPFIDRQRVTSLFAPPTVWVSLLRSPLFDAHDMSSLTHGYYGASSMPVEVLRELLRRLPEMRLWNCYGQTEIAPVATVLQPQDQQRKAGSVGRPVAHVRTRVVDDAMQDVPVGAVGEIVHRSPQLLSGYWNDPDATERAFAGGWFHSGDLATVDEEGFITIVDRRKDMIKSGGENVSSREVEEEIYRLEGVSEVAVIGLPDARWIETVAAFVVLKAGVSLDEDALINHCRASLAGFKLPKRIFFVDDLPRNASGKILKRQLRETVDRGDRSATPLEPEGSVQ